MTKLNWEKKIVEKKQWYQYSHKHHRLHQKARKWLAHNRKKLFKDGVCGVPFKSHY